MFSNYLHVVATTPPHFIAVTDSANVLSYNNYADSNYRLGEDSMQIQHDPTDSSLAAAGVRI